MAELPGAIVAFDLETTGLSARRDRITEIGAVRFSPDGSIESTFESFANPGHPIPIPIQRLTGITDDTVMDAPPPYVVVERFRDFSSDAWCIGHGVPFDVSFCEAEIPGMFLDRTVVDTVDIARIVLPFEERYSLSILSQSLDLVHDRPHRALSDADATRALFLHLVRETAKLPRQLLEELLALSGTGVTPGLRRYFEWICELPGTGSVSPKKKRATKPSTTSTAPSGNDVEAVFGPGGALSRQGQYEFRPEQREMATAVEQAFERRKPLLVEAGTGTGKTLAYLVPLLQACTRNGSRAVVATHTIALQHQIMDHDLPLALSLTGYDGAVALLKGRNHYLSRLKLTFLVRQILRRRFPDRCPKDVAVRMAMRLLVFNAYTVTGERSEITLTQDEQLVWPLVCCSSENEWRHRSREDVKEDGYFVDRARSAALAAGVVVTSHAMLVVDSLAEADILGEYSGLVVDEAHHLEDVATDQMTLEFDLTTGLRRWKTLARAHCGELALAATESALHFLELAVAGARACLRTYPASDTGHGVRCRIHDALTPAEEAFTLEEAMGKLALALEGVNTASEEEQLVEKETAEIEELLELVRSLTEVSRAWGSKEPHVRWIEHVDASVKLEIAPLHVGPAARAILERPETAILTSATLSISGSCAFTKERLGITHVEDLIVHSSSKDFLSHAACLVPPDAPHYESPGYDDGFGQMCAAIAREIGGHTVVLFTSYASLRRCHAVISRLLEDEDIAVLGQGVDGTLHQMLHAFTADSKGILLGTGAMWEGIDLPGNLAKCVIVAKLPFAVPNDPLLQARSEQYARPFIQYFLPLAALRLKQGFGRLVRSENDRGAVVIADPRLTTKEYGKSFLATLPDVAVEYLSLSEVPQRVAEIAAEDEPV